MRGDEFLDKMELVDADLVEAADRQLSSTAGSNHRKGGAYMARKIAALAAVIALMICSGAVGAIAFSSETIVEVPAEQETIELEADTNPAGQLGGKVRRGNGRGRRGMRCVCAVSPRERQRLGEQRLSLLGRPGLR